MLLQIQILCIILARYRCWICALHYSILRKKNDSQFMEFKIIYWNMHMSVFVHLCTLLLDDLTSALAKIGFSSVVLSLFSIGQTNKPVVLIRNSTAYRILVTCHTGMLQFVVICFQMECIWKLVVWRSEVCEIWSGRKKRQGGGVAGGVRMVERQWETQKGEKER